MYLEEFNGKRQKSKSFNSKAFFFNVCLSILNVDGFSFIIQIKIPDSLYQNFILNKKKEIKILIHYFCVQRLQNPKIRCCFLEYF